MGAQVLHFPVQAPASPPPAGLASVLRTRRRYRFADMVRLVGLEDFEPRTQVDHLRKLAAQCGLPLPRNPRVHGGKIMRGAAAIGQRSNWCALEIDAWLDGQHTPPPSAGALPAPAGPAVRAECRQRARLLAGA